MAIVVLISGSGTNLQSIIDAGLLIKFVMSDKHNAYGLERARKAKIPTLSQPKLGSLENSITKLCVANKVNLIVLAGFMRLLNPEFIKRWKGKIVNIHPSLLPSFKGAHAIEKAFEYGVKVTGVTVHYVDEGMDTGSIIAQQAVKVAKRDTVETLEEKIHKVEHKLYPKVIKDLLK